MTAPLRSGEPIVVPVALGARAYDIVIGRGLLASLGARIKALRRAPNASSSPTRRWRSIISRRRSRARIGEHRVVAHRGAAGRGVESYATFETVCEAIIAARIERGDLVVALAAA